MDSIGQVAAILNDTLLVVRMDNDGPPPSEQLTVFGRVTSLELEKLGIPRLDFPKGKIRILSKQADRLYLAERFRLSEKEVSVFESIGRNPSLMSSLLTKEITWSAALDKEQSLKIGVDMTVHVDDHVAR